MIIAQIPTFTISQILLSHTQVFLFSLYFKFGLIIVQIFIFPNSNLRIQVCYLETLDFQKQSWNLLGTNCWFEKQNKTKHTTISCGRKLSKLIKGFAIWGKDSKEGRKEWGWDLMNLWIDPWLDLDQQTSNLTTTTLSPLLHSFVFCLLCYFFVPF